MSPGLPSNVSTFLLHYFFNVAEPWQEVRFLPWPRWPTGRRGLRWGECRRSSGSAGCTPRAPRWCWTLTPTPPSPGPPSPLRRSCLCGASKEPLERSRRTVCLLGSQSFTEMRHDDGLSSSLNSRHEGSVCNIQRFWQKNSDAKWLHYIDCSVSHSGELAGELQWWVSCTARTDPVHLLLRWLIWRHESSGLDCPCLASFKNMVGGMAARLGWNPCSLSIHIETV